eukprot:scaffold10769_cov49-Phaeocystis_antarctica.AAC.7
MLGRSLASCEGRPSSALVTEASVSSIWFWARLAEAEAVAELVPPPSLSGRARLLPTPSRSMASLAGPSVPFGSAGNPARPFE